LFEIHDLYWAWDQALVFLIAWVVGGVLFALAYRRTRYASRRKRVIVCSLILAAAFTPSIVIHHALELAPAIYILIVSPFTPAYGVSYGALLGAVPIAIAWAAITGVWFAVWGTGAAS